MNLALVASSTTVHAQDSNSQQTETEATISGTVYLPGDNQPASQVAVSLRSHDAGVFLGVLTDDDGRFEVHGLAPGGYEITIDEQGFEPYRSTAHFDGSSLKLELHLARLASSVTRSANTVSVRELMIPVKAKEEYRKGLVSLSKKQLAKSLKHFTKAVRAFPGYFEAFYHQGVVETGLDHREEAMQAFQAAANLSGGRYARAQFGIGYMYYLQGNAVQAEISTRKGLEMDPNSTDGYVILGLVLLRLNRTDGAEKSAREALVRNPNCADAYLVLANVYARRRNYKEQIQDLDIYLKLAPNGASSKHVQEVRETVLRILNRIQPQN